MNFVRSVGRHRSWLMVCLVIMIFIRADGRILRIAENTEPLSTRIIPSRGLAKGVLEVIAGTAQKYGIQPGDRVAHPLFGGR